MENECKIDDYLVTTQIGEGSFGQVNLAQKDGRIYAIKTENIATIKPMVSLQYEIYNELHLQSAEFCKGQSFPLVYDYIEKEHFSYLVMQKLDTTLQDLVNLQLKNQTPKDTLILIMFNTLKSLEKLHQLGYLYRDVKPSNFMVCSKELDQGRGKIYLIDLGLCKKYIKKDSLQHIPLKTNKKMIGTPIFCSLNTHKGLQASRRDDLQAWVYMTLYFTKKLPWQDCSSKLANGQCKENKEQLYKEIGKIKEQTNMNALLKQEKKLPLCLPKIYDCIKNLQFQTRPNYEYIYNLLEQEYKKLTGKVSLKQTYFTLKSNIQNTNVPKNIKINFKIPEKKKNVQADPNVKIQSKKNDL